MASIKSYCLIMTPFPVLTIQNMFVKTDSVSLIYKYKIIFIETSYSD